MYGKLVNGEIEYFQRPSNILGDVSRYAIENGYMEIVEEVPEYSNLSIYEKLEPYLIIENGCIVRKYKIVDKTEDDILNDRLNAIPESISKVNLLIGLFETYNITPDQILMDINKIPNSSGMTKLDIEFKYSTYVKLDSNLAEFIMLTYNISKTNLEDLFINMKDK